MNAVICFLRVYMSGVIILIVEGHGQGEIIRFNWFPWAMCLGMGHVPKLTDTSVSRYILKSLHTLR